MATDTQATPPPAGFLVTATVYGLFSGLLWLAVEEVIPRLREDLGVSPLIGWYLSGTIVVLMPLLVFGSVMAWRELRVRSLSEWKHRLRLLPISREDALWTLGGLLVIFAASAVVIETARHLHTGFQPVPWFLLQSPGWHPWVFGAWIPLFVANILGEELCWRGYFLPRQESAFGRVAWLGNGIPWCLFHWSFGWQILIALLPITLLLPWIVQRRRNTSVGIIIHGVFNAAGFIVAISGVGVR